MTVIFQSQRQERPDSFAAEQCWESHGGLSAARSMWHWHLRRWVRGQARPLFLFNQFSVLRPTFTIDVATLKNQPVLIQVDCERSLLLKYMYVCCQAVTSSGRCKPNCNAHVVLRDWQSNLFSHFHMRMCEKNKLIYILMSVKWIVSKGSPHCHIYVLSPIENLSYNHIETRTTPAKICVETGLSILINQILNYNFSELTLSYVVKYDIPTHIHVLCLVRERHIWINVQTHSRKVLLMQRLHTAEIQMNSLFRLQPSIVKSTSNSMPKSCKSVVGAIFFIPLTFPSE